ncbi:8-oxo-dGTP diphosphatase [Yoonia maritima]|uniref:8-oxo-dGTP diphosphatase n=1 Tax=Yoonia maritima TaxID=1435347 RepID=A0A2T0VVJ0_9RHOB|nr:NUDIX hydrolase [Yoonia maritima]PRY75717.1 8-oxo-dGTP diphosphatase [Yoonia maritima]
MIKRYGNSPKPGQNYVLRPGAYAILPRDGQLLLTYQGEPHHEFQLPGGGIDPGESPIQALHREVFEETGWRIAKPMRVGVFRRFVYMPEYGINAEKICHIYLARPVRPHGPPSEAGHEAVWMNPRDAVQEIANDGDAAFIAGLID